MPKRKRVEHIDTRVIKSLEELNRETSFCDVYKTIENPHFRSFCVIKPDKFLITNLRNIFKRCGIAQLTSIGCGDGLIELLLSQFFTVTGIDFNTRREMAPCVRKHIRYYEVRRQEIIPIPSDHALFLSWPLLYTWREYFETYKGRCVVIYGDSTCEPYPPIDFAPYEYFRHWKQMHVPIQKNHGRSTLAIFVYVRI